MSASVVRPRVVIRGSGLLLDSNLLLLLAIGSYNPALISSFKRVAGYSIVDYKILEQFASGFRELVATPHVLTEVSNLANSLPSRLREGWFGYFAERIAKVAERNIAASQLAQTPAFVLFGLTDAALSLVAESTMVATADERLCDYLQRNGLHAISYNEIRVAYLAG